MRVFYDHQVTSLQDAGGVSRYYFELVRALAGTGSVNAEWMLGWNRSVLPVSELGPMARINSRETGMQPGYQRYAANEALTAAIVPLRGRFDVYHSTYQRVLPWVRRRAVVVTHHDSTPDRFPELFPDADAIHERLRKVYARADRIICISESSRDDLLRYFDVAPERTVVIHHGFTALAGSADEVGLLALPGDPFALYVGSRASYKNFPLVLAALAQVGNRELQLVVAGGGELTPKEQAAIEKHGLSARVRPLSRVTDAQLSVLYRRARMFVYPSFYEGFGFPPLEAMDAGCPALVSRSSALPEICGDAGFYFDPLSSEELAKLMTRMCVDEEFRLSKKAAGYLQARRYTWEKAAAETLAAYRDAIEAASS